MKNVMTGRLGGFTLIELLVVVLIIGILAAIAYPQYEKAVYKSRMVHTQLQAGSIRRAAQMYLLANGQQATTADDFAQDIGFNEYRNAGSNGAIHGWFGQDEWYDYKVPRCIVHIQFFKGRMTCRVCYNYGNNEFPAYCQVYHEKDVEFFKNTLRWPSRGMIGGAETFDIPLQ